MSHPPPLTTKSTIAIEDVAVSTDFCRLGTIAGLRIDLRYASENNFAQRNLYGEVDCAWLHCEAAAALNISVAWLAQQHPSLTVVVLDALRPQRVQEALWAKLAGTPLQSLYLAEPVRGSIHSFGMAVDVTLLGANGDELDMGTAFDALDEMSHPKFEAEFLAAGKLTQAHINNRQILRNAMQQGGFCGISTEWWHFDCGDRLTVRERYARVM